MAKDSPALDLIDSATRLPPWGRGLREYRFFIPRKWRFDLAWPDLKVAFECEGGVWSGGRHTTGAGFSADCEKYSVAAALGWAVIRATVPQINSGDGIRWVLGALNIRSGRPPVTGFGLSAGTRSRGLSKRKRAK